MPNYYLLINNEQSGPYAEAEIEDHYKNGHIDKNTLCCAEGQSEWQPINEYFPTLKYGIQFAPPQLPTPYVVRPQSAQEKGTVISDIRLPFGSVLRLALQFMLANLLIGACLAAVGFLFWATVLVAIFGSIGASMHHH